MTLIDLLRNAVERFHHRPALTMRPRHRTLQWSYADLARYACGIAERLTEEGISPGETVLLWMGNFPHWVGAFFGILLRGGVAVPLQAESLPEFIQKVSLHRGSGSGRDPVYLRHHGRSQRGFMDVAVIGGVQFPTGDTAQRGFDSRMGKVFDSVGPRAGLPKSRRRAFRDHLWTDCGD